MAPRLDKETIDALVDGLPPVYSDSRWKVWAESVAVVAQDLRRALYLAAGLTAEGERKPERVRCWQWTYKSTGVSAGFSDSEPFTRDAELTGCRVTPGWFVPDGAE